MSNLKERFRFLLAKADIIIDGNRPWDIHVKNNKLYDVVVHNGHLGLGEAYIDGWWECEQIDEFISRCIRAKLDQYVKGNYKLGLCMLLTKLNLYKSILFNLQNKKRSLKVAKKHYDIGNDLYKVMLDKELNYTCGYWNNTDNLNEAQKLKCKLICDKLSLKKGMKVLDIGCGWGSFARFAAENYGVSVVGISISKNQVELAKEKSKGLPIEIRLQDYRDISEKFDAIVSIGMFEHVGYKNYPLYMKTVYNSLSSGGLFLLHTIGSNDTATTTDPWINKYIFPNGVLPSIKQIGSSIENMFVMEDWHNFGIDYYKTLIAWHNNFQNGWDRLKDNYSKRFKRMWRYYLLLSAGNFKSRYIQLWQIVLSKDGLINGYKSKR